MKFGMCNKIAVLVVVGIMCFTSQIWADETKVDDKNQGKTEETKANKDTKDTQTTKASSKVPLSEIIEKMDKKISGYDDQYMKLTMNIYDVDGSKKAYDFEMWQKGVDKRLLRFRSGEMKGFATLILDRNNVWAYLPAFKKVRRVAATNMKQSIAGSDFSNEDMSVGSWGKDWNITLDKEDDKFYYLKATPKEGVNTVYASALLVVEKGTYYQDHVDYFNEKGQKVKVYYLKNLTDFGLDMKRHQIVGMLDPRNGHKTELFVHEMKANTGMKDKLFTKRNLQWGR